MKVVNLASRPFVNERPVVRLAVTLWVLGGILLATNFYSYSTYWKNSEEIREELSEVRTRIDEEKDGFRDLGQSFAAIDIRGMNEQADFLNQLIRYRTFPWSRLFDNLEETLPFEVRLTAVRPELEQQKERAPRQSPRRQGRRSSRRGSSGRESEPAEAPPPPKPEEVQLAIQGTAKRGDAILEFVDNLFGHRAFRSPELLRESRVDSTGFLTFDVKVVYLTETGEELSSDDDNPVKEDRIAENEPAESPSPGSVEAAAAPHLPGVPETAGKTIAQEPGATLGTPEASTDTSFAAREDEDEESLEPASPQDASQSPSRRSRLPPRRSAAPPSAAPPPRVAPPPPRSGLVPTPTAAQSPGLPVAVPSTPAPSTAGAPPVRNKPGSRIRNPRRPVRPRSAPPPSVPPPSAAPPSSPRRPSFIGSAASGTPSLGSGGAGS